MFSPIAFLQNTSISYLPKIRGSSYLLYIFSLLGITGGVISLPLIHTDISVKTTGIIRPLSERTEVKPVIGGIIDSILFKEGDKVKNNDAILLIKDHSTKSKKTVSIFEINQRVEFIYDLQILTSSQIFIKEDLKSPLYREKYSKFLHQKDELELQLKKLSKEVEMNTSLAKEKVISPKEFFDIQNNQERIQSNYNAFLREQQSIWQQDLVRYRLELVQYQQQLQQVNTDASYYEVRAPTAGIIQGINTRYIGGLIQANETLCTISPEGNLIGECYVKTKDVGLIKQGQIVKYQIEAFDYNYFGVLSGRVLAIDNDYTVINNTLIFKVRCSFDSTQLHLKNGFSAELKKGLNFQARFAVSRRSLWQLLYDKLDDWLNPSAPSKTVTTSY